MSLLGDAGLQQLATLNHENACHMADIIDEIKGANVLNETFFNEFTVRLDKPAAEVVQALADKGVLGGVPFSRISGGQHEGLLLVCATETASDEDMQAFGAALEEVLS
jgi:glycine dehydrogenase subunit 1